MSADKYIEFGQKYYGKFVNDFCHWIAAQAGDNKIFFLARDAYFYRKYAIAKHIFNSTPGYLSISKKSLTLPLMGTDIDPQVLLTYIFANKTLTIEELILACSITDVSTVKLKDYDLSQTLNRDNPKDREIALEVINYVRESFSHKITEQTELLKIYLSVNEATSGTIYLVDVGWRGSIQFALQYLANSFGFNCHFIGLYVGIIESEHMGVEARGFLYYNNPNKSYYQIMSAVGIFEMVGMEPVGTATGFVMNSKGVVESVKRNYEFDGLPQAKEIELIQQGALGFSQKDTGDFLQAISKPNKEVMTLFSEWKVSNNLLRDLISDSLFTSLWKSGFLTKKLHSGKLAFFAYYIMKHI